MTQSSTTLPAPSSHYDEDWLIKLCERGWIPDFLVRRGMRNMMLQRLLTEGAYDGERRTKRLQHLLIDLRNSPIAINTHEANEQHYELPPAFFAGHLGPQLKYSCCLYETGHESLGEAEEAMLACYAQRADLKNGQDILELGCGWGSLSLWMAKRFPDSRIHALSNSYSQREFILSRAQAMGIRNLTVFTGNIVDFEFSDEYSDKRFDRVMSIEMFEHMKNYGLLLAKIGRWMRDDAKLFVHIFAHRNLAYHFEIKDSSDWMSRYFFTGGTMPSESLFLNFQNDLKVSQQWWVNGGHYERTANQWLAALDKARPELLPLFISTYGQDDASIWLQRWRMFYMAVAELFGYDQGNEWGVGHYLFEKHLHDKR